MAATAAYIRMAPIPTADGGTGDTAPAFSNISATTAAFTIVVGGLYGATVKASTFGTVTLQILLPDDTTWATGDIAAFSADGWGKGYLTPGQYRWAIA